MGNFLPVFDTFWTRLDPGPTHGSGSDFGPGYPGPRPGSGRSTSAVVFVSLTGKAKAN